MQFEHGSWATKVRRLSELKGLDSLGVDNTMKVASEIRRYVGPWGVWDRTIVKIARLIVERKISPVKVGELIETTLVRLRLPREHKHYPKNPGAFFMQSVMNAVAEAGLPWNGGDRDEE
jgi:hypothetical protein